MQFKEAIAKVEVLNLQQHFFVSITNKNMNVILSFLFLG